LAVEPPPDDLLGRAARANRWVHIGGVDQVAAAFHIVIQHRARSRLIGFLPEGHRPQRELGHEDAGLAK